VFKKEFYRSLKEASENIKIMGAGKEAFQVINFIYNKAMDWEGFDLGILSSLYYLLGR
jgi:hypothetical protein